METIYKILELLKEKPELVPIAYGLIFVFFGGISYLITRSFFSFFSERSIRKEVKAQSDSIKSIDKYFNRIETLVQQLNNKVFNLLAKHIKK